MNRETYVSDLGMAAWWQKDGAWHVAARYFPTEEDRMMFPKSYPRESDGPFFRYVDEAFDTREEALDFIALLPCSHEWMIESRYDCVWEVCHKCEERARMQDPPCL